MMTVRRDGLRTSRNFKMIGEFDNVWIIDNDDFLNVNVYRCRYCFNEVAIRRLIYQNSRHLDE